MFPLRETGRLFLDYHELGGVHELHADREPWL